MEYCWVDELVVGEQVPVALVEGPGDMRIWSVTWNHWKYKISYRWPLWSFICISVLFSTR